MHVFCLFLRVKSAGRDYRFTLSLLTLLMQDNIASALSFDLIIGNSIGQELKNGVTALLFKLYHNFGVLQPRPSTG
jgi:hypothetical protein